MDDSPEIFILEIRNFVEKDNTLSFVCVCVSAQQKVNLLFMIPFVCLLGTLVFSFITLLTLVI